ncbi:hypothetical protein AQUCO_03400119v1 [Aquilegia coerulea]|uniref:ZZ-type domain-containing protein n=1 Tax=Aquilegia coerulea TaxID=218851 RepID=A0A2G5CXK1_AQUCA|nr:hypothetical protein AQUCO_03400119v1 [Aquilegia coerulea]
MSLPSTEEEKKRGCFSPQLDDNISSSPCTSSTMCSPVEDVAQEKIKPLSIVEQRSHQGGTHVVLETTRTLAAEGNNLLDSNFKNGTCELLSVEDVLCFACKQLLYKPAVLNCGHVYCLSCISSPTHEAVKCQLCQRLHPKGFLNVCLELDHLLEKKFPKEYALRRETVQHQPINSQQGNPSAGVGEDGKQSPQTCSNMSWLGDRGVIVHYGAGCDFCGICPIVGERYRCIDCVEEIGFDLCEECYNTRSKLPGRFNQQHTPEHKFELVRPNPMRSLLIRWVSEHSEDSSVPVHSDDASEDPEGEVPLQALPDEAPVDQEEETHFTI